MRDGLAAIIGRNMINRRQKLVILTLIILSLFLLSGCDILGDLGGALQDSIDGIMKSFKF